MRPRRPVLDHAALLVIDMQEYFRSIAEPVLPSVAALLGRLRERGVPVLFTQHGHDEPAQDGGMLFEWWDEHILVGTPEWQLLSEIAPREGEAVFRKKRYSAFFGTDLADRLRSGGITDLVIAGVMTNLCCETTARDAFVNDFRVFFLSDGTATVGQEMHEASLRNLEYGFATLLMCEEIA
ncbi:MAG: isochorismatase family protein [Planctomycetota bacterium]|jgi:nicotinamidase-related amidase